MSYMNNGSPQGIGVGVGSIDVLNNTNIGVLRGNGRRDKSKYKRTTKPDGTVVEEIKMNELKEYTEKLFEDIKYIDEKGNEYWYARELSKVLEYRDWRNFLRVLNKSKKACKNSGFNIDEQLVEVNKLSKRNNNAVAICTLSCALRRIVNAVVKAHERFLNRL